MATKSRRARRQHLQIINPDNISHLATHRRRQEIKAQIERDFKARVNPVVKLVVFSDIVNRMTYVTMPWQVAVKHYGRQMRVPS